MDLARELHALKHRLAQLEEPTEDSAWFEQELKDSAKLAMALQDSEQRLRALTEASFEALFLSRNGICLDQNFTAEQMFGYTLDEAIGKPSTDWFAEPDRDGVEEAILSGREAPYTALALRKDGGTFPAEIQGRDILYKGQRTRVTALRDLTEKAQALEDLHAEQALTDTIIDSLPGLFFFIDEELRFHRWNNNAESITGYSSEEFKQRTALEFIFEEDRPRVMQHIVQALNDGASQVEARLLTRTGQRIPFFFRAVSIVLGEQRYLVGVGSDLSAQYEAEAELTEKTALLENILHSAQELAIATVGLDYRVTYFNPAMERIFAQRAEDIIGHSILEINAFEGPQGEQVRHLFESLEDGGTHHFSMQVPSDGGPRELEARLGAILDPSGGTVGYAFYGRDVTDRNLAEESRLDLERQVLHAQKLESLGIMAGGVAHDFNNLLSAILGNADLALQDVDADSPAIESIEQIGKAARRAAALAGQMLDYSGRGQYLIEPVDLTRLVSDMKEMLHIAVPKKADLRLYLAKTPPLFEGDADQVRQVVLNLVTNAAESLGKDGGTITVTTGERFFDRAYLEAVEGATRVGNDHKLREGRYTYFEVVDTGCGMEDEVLQRIYEPFFTTKFTGRGLGLASVQGIVRGHRGTIEVSSEVGFGSRFRVLLPVPKETDSTLDEYRSLSYSDDWRGEGTVLVVDDEEAIRIATARMLVRMGFTVLEAADGREALRLFQRDPSQITCVVLDLTMPHMDGRQTFFELRAIQPDVVVVLSSGYNEEEAMRKVASQGLAGFLHKPYDSWKLRTVLHRALGAG